jgi:integrase
MATLRKQGDRFYLQFYDKSKSPRQKTIAIGAVTSKAAHRIKARKQDEVALGMWSPWDSDEDAMLSDAVNQFVKSKADKSARTVSGYFFILTSLCHVIGDMNVRNIRRQDIELFLESTATNDVSKHTYVAHIKAFLQWSVESGIANKNVAKEVSLPRIPNKFPNLFSESQVDMLCLVIEREASGNPLITQGDPRWMIPVIRFAIETGLRRSELCNAKWTDVSGGWLHVYSTKTMRDRRIPLTEAALKVLGGLTKSDEKIFLTSAGSPIYPPYFSRLFRRYCVLAELPCTRVHALRHTACSRLASRGVPVEVIRRFAGHSTIMVTERYMHVSDDGFSSWFS